MRRKHMSKRIRQYLGLISAVVVYYVIHEGAHLLYALCLGSFKKINLMGMGVQIDVYSESMTEAQLGVFCILGSVSTLLIGYLLVFLTERICKMPSKVLRACAYYVTIALLLIDPLYLSALCGFFGGGDMNGISLLVPELAARIIYGVVLIVNILAFAKLVLPKYKLSFASI